MSWPELCSTPCGIRGFGRGYPRGEGSIAIVLNALRHQRFWQASRRICGGVAGSAQRLAASEVLADHGWAGLVRPLRCSTPCGIRGFGRSFPPVRLRVLGCAQRLAASEVLAVSFPFRVIVVLYVLNALRHQRFWQVQCLPPSPGVYLVLNALRHQRFWQQLVIVPVGLPSLCSTPCGIRGFGRSKWPGQPGINVQPMLFHGGFPAVPYEFVQG